MTTQWHKTSCVLCAQNCGLEVQIEAGRIGKVRAGKDNPRSKGYVCRKGLNVAHYQHNAQRLKHPLKRVGDTFEEISWDQAIGEIAARLSAIVKENGPRSFAYMGGGGQGGHFEAAFGVRFLRTLGSHYHYSPLAQELTGLFWVMGRVLGRQYLGTIPHVEEADMLVAWGWNGWMSHQMPRARLVIEEFSKNSAKIMAAVDPRRSETAKKADLHLAVRPGGDAILMKSMIALILDKGWEKREYLGARVSGWDKTEPLFRGFDYRAGIRAAGLEHGQVEEFCRLLTTRNWCSHSDLGVLMGRHSTAVSWLESILMAVCGRIGVRGGNLVPGSIMPMGSHADERDERTWRTVTTGFPAIMGTFPPNVMPEEILSDNPERLRAVIVSGSNPLRSYADTTAYEKAFAKLDLLVAIEVAMSETAALAHYVLPARTPLESPDGTFFSWTWPEIYFQMRRPVVEPEGEPLEGSQIFIRLARAMGMLPEIPGSLMEAAGGHRLAFGQALMQFVAANPRAKAMMPFILGETLGVKLGSANLAALWGLLMTAPRAFQAAAARAGWEGGPMVGETLFTALMENPQGLIVGLADEEDLFSSLQTPDKKVNLEIPELYDWVDKVDAESETRSLEPDPEYPFILNAGRHMDMNANTIMRNPAWNKGKRDCTLALNPGDAARLGLADGAMARVTTAAGSVEVEVEVTEETRPGMVIIPHGFGLVYQGKAHGVNVNRLTPASNRDPVAGTPLHRYVPCRVEAA